MESTKLKRTMPCVRFRKGGSVHYLRTFLTRNEDSEKLSEHTMLQYHFRMISCKSVHASHKMRWFSVSVYSGKYR